MNDTITIIITNYNYGMYVDKAIQSVFNQTYQNFELVIINDGSTDNSAEIISIAIEGHENVTYISRENKGIVATRNEGLSLVNGTYFIFLDADNYWTPDYLESLYQVAKESNADIVYGDLRLVNVSGDEIAINQFPEFSLERLLFDNFIDVSALAKADIANDFHFDNYLSDKSHEDYDFWLGTALAGKKIVKADCYLNYLIHGNSRNENQENGVQKWEKIDNSITYIKRKYKDLYPEVFKNFRWMNDNSANYYKNYIKASKLETSVAGLENHIQSLEAINENLNLANKDLSSANKDLELRNQLILNSRSYKLGKLIVKMIKYPSVLGTRVKNKVFQSIHKIPSLKQLSLQVVRKYQRKKNNYIHPNRFLIYVIYEEQKSLKEYKYHFLKALSKLSNEILIVVNGNLSASDLERLSHIGQVEFRENTGYDVAAFKYGLEKIGPEGLKKYDELLLVNDSNVGPFSDLAKVFEKMNEKKLDFWGISYGEELAYHSDFSKYNRYHYIPLHLQTYFLVIEKSMFESNSFYRYWDVLGSTNSREEAIGKHETVFTKYFSDLGFRFGAVTSDNVDSAMYIHPLKMLKEGVPLVKYSAFSNDTNDKFLWQGLERQTEIPELLDYIKNETNYPMSIIDQIMMEVKEKEDKKYILIIDGVENIIPQCTRYRVLNKAEQFRSLGYEVRVSPNSTFNIKKAEYASVIIIYRAAYSEKLGELLRLAKKEGKPVFYDIDDLVIDTKYTDLLDYTQTLSASGKDKYDSGVRSYGRMLNLCDGAIVSTTFLQKELESYQETTLLNRNLISEELASISSSSVKNYLDKREIIKIGYFSGSIANNENFELIKSALVKLLQNYSMIELHLAGHLAISKELDKFSKRIVTHNYIDWKELPELIGQMDINLAPLVNSAFNQAKSEIKWLEASLVKVPTIASNVGSFAEMIKDNETGILASDDEWYEKLEFLIHSDFERQRIGEGAYQFVVKNCLTVKHKDELSQWIEINSR